MTRIEQAGRRAHLRLVEPANPRSAAPLILTDPSARSEFETLTQALLDCAIEILDLADGDADVEVDEEPEANGDEFEDDGSG